MQDRFDTSHPLLVHPLDGQDSCGVGFVADIGGNASHTTQLTTLES